MVDNTVYLNGRYLPIDEAHISVLDRGFLFGDGIYELIPAYRGRLFEFEAHMARLDNSLAGIDLNNPHNLEQWRAIFRPLLQDHSDRYVYLQITRGTAPRRDHLFPVSIEPTVFAMSSPIPAYPSRENGITAVSLEDSRWQNCHIKTINLLANVLLRQQSLEAGGAEAILIKEGLVTEGSSSNVFAVFGDFLATPPLSRSILPGITRSVILKLAQENHIPYREQNFSLTELRQADEIWIASSIREIIAVVQLDNQTIGSGKPGPLWHRTFQLFQAYKQSYR